MRQCKVCVHGIYAGLLTEDNQRHYRFEYDDVYLQNKDASPVCLAMPTSQTVYESDVLFPFFSNMLSEGENRAYQARLFRIDEKDDFGILLATANYDTIGCVTVIPA